MNLTRTKKVNDLSKKKELRFGENKTVSFYKSLAPKNLYAALPGKIINRENLYKSKYIM